MPVNRIGTRRPQRDNEPRRRRATVGLITGVAVSLSGSLGLEPAHAGTYVMRNCSVPGHPSSPIGPWRAQGPPSAVVVDACADGDGVSFGFVGSHEVSPGGWSALGIGPPPQGARSGIGFVKATLWYAV